MSAIFIAHVEEDGEIALKIALALEKAGYATWSYEIDSVPGPSYIVTTGESVAKSEAVIVIISSHSLGSNQVTKEIVRAHESAKHFVPILRDVSHVEFQQRQPEWREAIGSATSIRIPQSGIEAVIPSIIEGIKILNIQPSSGANQGRIFRIQKALDEIISPDKKPSVDKPPPEKRIKARSNKPILITAAVLLVIMVVVIVILALKNNPTGTDGNQSTASPTATATITKTITAAPTVTEKTVPASSTPTSAAPAASATPSSSPPATTSPAVTTPAVSLPDFAVLDIAWTPQNPTLGQDVTFTAAVTNRGNAKAAERYLYVHFYVDGVFQEDDDIYQVAPGSTEKAYYLWKAELGSHIIKAVADLNNLVPEKDETNNEREITFANTVAADLIVSDITLSPVNPSSGERVNFTVTVTNQGNGPAGNFSVGYYLNGNYYSAYSVDALFAGQSTTVIYGTSCPGGTFIFKAVADFFENRVFESDETNNSKSVSFSIE